MKHDSYLIQRLEKPFSGFGQFKDNPFSFGGGLRNGGLSEEAMGLLRGLFSFDYMGAAEFEFGAVPEALNKIANNGNLAASSFELTPEVTVYTICDAEDVDEAEARVRSWILPWNKRPHMKEDPLLGYAIEEPERYDRVCGWLELDNGWFAFTNKEMFEGVAKLFGVEVNK